MLQRKLQMDGIGMGGVKYRAPHAANNWNPWHHRLIITVEIWQHMLWALTSHISEKRAPRHLIKWIGVTIWVQYSSYLIWPTISQLPVLESKNCHNGSGSSACYVTFQRRGVIVSSVHLIPWTGGRVVIWLNFYLFPVTYILQVVQATVAVIGDKSRVTIKRTRIALSFD